MELKPFCVSANCIVAGTVASNTGPNPSALPDGSLYQAVEDLYKWRAATLKNIKLPSAKYFTVQVTSMVLREK
jgi:hypothetical protein